MAKLSGSGHSAGKMSERQLTIRLGHQFYTILDKAHRLGYLDDLIKRQTAWLEQNPSDPRCAKRDSIRFRHVYERNVLVGEIAEDAATFAKIRDELSEQAVTEIQQALGIPMDRHTGNELAAIGRKYWGLNVNATIERWCRNHSEPTAYETPEEAA